jgi:hypothetical protein
MSSSFKIIEHVIPGQHIREYPHATKNGRNQETPLKIAIKQYVPLDQADSTIPDNAVTIIGAHGNGFPKVSQPRHHCVAVFDSW